MKYLILASIMLMTALASAQEEYEPPTRLHPDCIYILRIVNAAIADSRIIEQNANQAAKWGDLCPTNYFFGDPSTFHENYRHRLMEHMSLMDEHIWSEGHHIACPNATPWIEYLVSRIYPPTSGSCNAFVGGPEPDFR